MSRGAGRVADWMASTAAGLGIGSGTGGMTPRGGTTTPAAATSGPSNNNWRGVNMTILPSAEVTLARGAAKGGLQCALDMGGVAYFEVRVTQCARRVPIIGIGWAPAGYDLTNMPGWVGGSVALHTDDGKLFDGVSAQASPCMVPAEVGSVIGCGWIKLRAQAGLLFVFTRNQCVIGFAVLPGGKRYFPTIGFHQAGDCATIHFAGSLPQPALWPEPLPMAMPEAEGIEVGLGSVRASVSPSARAHDAVVSAVAAERGGVIVHTPLSPDRPFFEITVVSIAAGGAIGIGLAPLSYPLGFQPGWHAGSVGYHSDDGQFYHGLPEGEYFGPPFGEGDVIGCGIYYEGNIATEVGFTRNGLLLGRYPIIASSASFHPMIGLKSRGDSIRFAFAEPPASMLRPLDAIVGIPVVPDATLICGVPVRLGDETQLFPGGVIVRGEAPTGIQTLVQLSPDNPYFQVLILNHGQDGAIGIGLGGPSYDLVKMPGWERGSIGYHADDGRLYIGEMVAPSNFGPKCVTGDVMGCGVQFHQGVPEYLHIVRNQRLVGSIALSSSQSCYALVCMHGAHAAAKVWFCAPPVKLPGIEPPVQEIDIRKAVLEHIHASPLTIPPPRAHVWSPWITFDGVSMTSTDGAGGLQSTTPLNPRAPWFEVTVVHQADAIGVGIGCAEYDLCHMAGWDAGSYAMHLDDGNLYREMGSGVAFGMPANIGDVVRCTVTFDRSGVPASLSFHMNMRLVGEVRLPPHIGCFALVTLGNTHDSVQVKFSEAPVGWTPLASPSFAAGFSATTTPMGRSFGNATPSASPPADGSDDANTVPGFLASIGLTACIDALLAAGYDDLSLLVEIADSKEDFQEVVQSVALKPGHALKLRKELERRKAASATPKAMAGTRTSEQMSGFVRNIDPAELDVVNSIGSGSFGKVFRAVWRGGDVAVKSLLSLADPDAVIKELNAMAHAGNHPHVVPLLGTTMFKGSLCIVMAYMPHGSLLNLLQSCPSLSELDLVRIAAEAAAGVDHLHKEGVVHRDLACRNFLVDEANHVRVSDFGLARCVDAGSGGTTQVTETRMGPVPWMAPESITRQQYSPATDVFMFGVCLYEISTRCRYRPWVGYSVEQVLQHLLIERRTVLHVQPDGVPKWARGWIQRCCSFDPEDRPAMADILTTLRRLVETGLPDDEPSVYDDPTEFLDASDDWNGKTGRK